MVKPTGIHSVGTASNKTVAPGIVACVVTVVIGESGIVIAVTHARMAYPFPVSVVEMRTHMPLMTSRGR